MLKQPCTLLLSAVLVSVSIVASAQSRSSAIELKGIAHPSNVTTALIADCFNARFEVGISLNSLGKGHFTTFTVNGKDSLSSSSVLSANTNISDLSRPYFSGITCRDDTSISIAVSGMEDDMTGRDEVIRIFELSSVR